MNFKKIALINLAILLVILALGFAVGLNDKAEGPIVSLILQMFAIGAQVAVNAIIAIVMAVNQRTAEVKHYFFAALLVLLVGFGLCSGEMFVIDKLNY
ncbi:MAG: hypothetical protein MUC97_04470 [Bernardetiaceae bacterium]|nr:hypothetical protein [Bernardetiaceae bacterium]